MSNDAEIIEPRNALVDYKVAEINDDIIDLIVTDYEDMDDPVSHLTDLVVVLIESEYSLSSIVELVHHLDHPAADKAEELVRSITTFDVPGEMIRDKKDRAPDTFKNSLAAIRISGLCPAFNRLTGRVEFTASELPWKEGGRLLNDNTLRLVRQYLHLQINKFEPSKDNVFEALMTQALERSFHPILDYLDGLKWDGVPRIEKLFSEYFNVTDEDPEYVKAVSFCWAVAAVRRVRHPGCKFDTMPILKSPKQGLDKSTALKVLCGANWFSDAELGDLKKSDSALLLEGVWIHEFADSVDQKLFNAANFKPFTSRSSDRLRRPYGRVTEDLPRQSVFIATVNGSGYLKDPTGGRRYWPLTVTDRVDVKALERDRDQIWAEAAHLETQGESIVLPEKLWGVAAEVQAEETTSDPWADTIRGYLVDAEIDKIHAARLLKDVLKIPVDRQERKHSQRLRSVMVDDIGWKHTKSLYLHSDTLAGYIAPEAN